MSYYETIGEDLVRAKAILETGKASIPPHIGEEIGPELVERLTNIAGGMIFGADNYAAYKLLESFVDQVESYQLLLAVMGVTDYKAAVLAWKARGDLLASKDEELLKANEKVEALRQSAQEVADLNQPNLEQIMAQALRIQELEAEIAQLRHPSS